MEKLTIETPRLRIRNLKPSDAGDFHNYRSNREIVKYQSFDVMTLEEAHDFIRQQQAKLFGKPGEWVQYAVEDKTTGRLIGDCAIKLQEEDRRIAEVGITISHRAQKNGYAQETLRGILEFLFDTHQIHRVVETVDAENVASLSLLRRTGFREEGHFIENIFFKGKWGSEYQFAMLKSEWENLKRSH
ncbi:MAG TPA: GNAT family N-acetyltransferase [Flavobacterium sp.]|jgi:RimJ/RimL family protein N-acetyltransferase